LLLYVSGCHVKVHKDHFDRQEEFVAYCKGKCVKSRFIV
jgi:hypothetical protein